MQRLSQQICGKISTSSIFSNSSNIASYISINNEVDLSNLNNHNKDIVLPVITSSTEMAFSVFRKSEGLIKNKFGIPEPSNREIVHAKNIQLCLMPLTGFNRNGHRLGMGGGFYDRYFALNKTRKKPTILVGVAYDFQEDDTIQPELWDIPLDMIFTNKEVIYCE